MPRLRPSLVIPLSAAVVLAVPADAAVPIVREARLAIVFSDGRCDVTARIVIDTAEPEVVEHHLMLHDERQVPAFAVVGAFGRDVMRIGRTARLPIALTGSGRNDFTVRYRFDSARVPLDRCPLLVPSAATDGVSRAVSIEVEVPRGAVRLPGEFPAFAWAAGRGRVTLGHVPAFVRLPFTSADAVLTWRDRLDPKRVVDVAALAAIALATLAWVTLGRTR